MNRTKNKNYVLDTCTIISIMENRFVADLINCHIDSKQCNVYVNSVSIEEAERNGYAKKQVLRTVLEYLGTLLTVKDVSDKHRVEADRLEDECPLIHSGDSAIAAFTADNKATLITYDKDLLMGCRIVRIPTFNPNMVFGGMAA